ncbi:MAG: LPS export ABC transporter ATP-binding protein [Candidatus Cloacimonetes bacterium]|nr:LPS export ABC transporter ATP-binding protein [Candidatus Cloacimonadota bacterium]
MIENKELIVRNIQKSYGGRQVVSDVSLSMKTGDIIGLLGPNGAGKTTSFYMIVGLVKPDSGTIFLDGKDLTKYPMYQRARLGIGYLAQEASVFRHMSVMDNILSILEFVMKGKKNRIKRAEELMGHLSLDHVKHSLGSALSGGERRRAEIARALATNPDFLLLDEPFAGVDPIAVAEIQSIIKKLREEIGIGILITDHNVRETLKICDKTYVMNKGQILVSGSVKDITNNEEAKRIYLGEDFSM